MSESESDEDQRRQVAIADYALLLDCHAPALVSRDGSVDWWCPPRADEPSVFGRLLDADAGHWQLSADGPLEISRRYLDDTMVLETTITTATGDVRVFDCLSLEPGAGARHRLPGAAAAGPQRGGVAGQRAMRWEFAPRIEYGLTVPHLHVEPGAVVAEGGRVRLRLSTPVEPSVEDGTATAQFVVDAGRRVTFAVAYSPAAR